MLLAAREAGYRSLMRLSSRAFLDTPPNEPPRLKLEWLEGETDGIIALTGGPGGPLDGAIAAGQSHLATTRLDALHRLFGDRLYVELQRHGTAHERMAEPVLIDLAYGKGIPLVATNEPYFATAADHEAHDALICIAEGRLLAETDRRQAQCRASLQEPRRNGRAVCRSAGGDRSTVEIAERCAFRPHTHQPILPRFSVGDSDEASELRKRAEAGLARRLASAGVAPGHTEDEYRERLEFELGVIAGMKYPGYFLIVADFIQWAKAKGIPVGPGRGSGAGSLVSYALTITDLDPIRFGLLFERFLNPERVSMPDFDIDFCQDRRDEVIRYVQERYGRDQVAQIITFGTLQARGVLRDVGRVLQMPYGQVDKLCKLVPQNPTAPVTLAQAIEGEPKLQAERDGDPVVKRAFDIARKLEGLTRHASTHAAGIVIGDRALSELVPLYRDPKSDMPVTQFNMKWVEQAGLVKFDFLGLKTLTVLADRGRAGEAARHRDRSHAPFRSTTRKPTTCWRAPKRSACSNWKARACGARCSTCGPTASRTSSRWSRSIAPVRWRTSRLIARASTIWRSRTTSTPSSKPILKETFGVIVYQEQVMQAAQILAGYTLGQADLLRRAMGKKIRKEMQAQRAIFVEGAIKNGIERYQADAIFDLLERFAEYGFNKSHAAAYALVAYQTAYMKANYPVEFLAASMTLDMGNTDKLAEFRAEAERLGIKVDPPSINRSHVAFEVDGNTIIYALAALKGVGRQAVEAIVAAREAGKFADLADFADRINPRAVNKRVLESLAQAGAFDEFEQNRARVFPAMDAVLARAQRAHDSASIGQNELFGGGGQREPIALPQCRAVAAGRAAAARIRGGRLFPLRPSARRLRRRAEANCACSPGPIFRAR